MKIYEIEAGQKLHFKPSNTKLGNTYPEFLRNCSDAILAMQEANKFLYRGIEKAPPMFHGRSRNDRNAMDTSSSVTGEVNKLLNIQGLVANRSNSIFCTSNQKDATQYGIMYAIFPVNGFKFTWSPVIRDMTHYFSSFSIWNPGDLFKISKTNVANDRESRALYMDVTKLRGELNFTRFVLARSSGNEDKLRILENAMMQLGYALSFKSSDITPFDPQQLAKDLSVVKDFSDAIIESNIIEKCIRLIKIKKLNPDVSQEDIIAGLDYRNTDLAAALKSGNEIMVHGEYYAFEYKRYGFYLDGDLLQ